MSTPIAIVLISTDGHAQFLTPCLKSIIETCNDLALKIVLIDNDGFGLSSKEAAEWQDFLDIKIIHQKKPKGFAANFNDAMHYVDEPYVLLLNVDTLMTENTLAASIHVLIKNPQIGALTVRLVGFDNKLQSSARAFPTPLILLWEQIGISRLFPRSKVFGKSRLHFSAQTKLTFVDWISGAFILARREAINDVNGMDEDYFLYTEDTDLGMRLKKNGWQVAIDPQHSIFHHKDPLGTKRRKENFILTHKNLLLFLKKHYLKNTYLQGRIVLFLGLILRFAALPLLAKKGKTYILESAGSYFRVLIIITSGHLEYK